MPNRLAQEHSLYLKQHGENPVDWYPWGEDALARAKAENKLIHLSVGYSSCHWCHVMAHECFENEAIARTMNERFINIKVDREERPDVDTIYQNVAQIFTRGGGWPLTVFLLPDGRPVYGGTYFPPEDRHGRPGFPRVLLMLSDMWDASPTELFNNAEKVNEVMSKLLETPELTDVNAESALAHVRAYFERLYDPVNGGFGNAPKFPNTMGLTYLWRSGAHAIVTHSLLKMINGGIFDQLGGGFHRYSVDESWSVPHFEKMLYDQALILKLIAEVLTMHQLESVLKPDEEMRLREALILSIEYLNREMKSPQGLFYMAQDADTILGEGFNFVWDQDSVRECFTDPKDQELFTRAYQVSEQGNFEHGKSVLSYNDDIGALALHFSVSPTKLRSILTRLRQQAFEFRLTRPKPVTDTKISSGLNGLLLSALAWSYGALKDERVLETATLLAEQLRSRFWDPKLRRLKSLDYQSASLAYLSDYVFVARGMIDLCRVLPSDSERAMQCWVLARDLIDVSASLFRDERGDFSETSSEHEKLIFRVKAGLDQAIPSSVAVWMECAQVLGPIPGVLLRDEMKKMLGLMSDNPFGSGEMAQVVMAQSLGHIEITHPSSYVGFMHPRLVSKPDLGIVRAQYCVGQTCYPYDGVESVRLKLMERRSGV